MNLLRVGRMFLAASFLSERHGTTFGKKIWHMLRASHKQFAYFHRRRGGRSTMTDQPDFDVLRRNCSATLKQFITDARATERYMHDLSLPVGVQEFHQLMTKRQAEYAACHEYLVASEHLVDFLKRQLQYIQ